MKKIITSALLSCLLLTANSQSLTQTVKGQITDQQSGAPIIGATAQVEGISPPLGSITDVNGYFRIEKVPIGRHSIQVSYLGYEPALLSEILVGSGKEVVINIKLVESLQQLDEVVISTQSQEKGQPINELSTISTISLSVEETSRFAATFDDPARAALTFAGVQTGGDDLLNEIVIRGNSPKGILWRLEGVEIPNPNHFTSVGSSAGGISMLSSSVLSNSDFFTGAFPAQYGNATSGIFDLNLRKGNFDKHEHAFQAGLLGIAAASEGPLSKDSRASYLINYRYSTLGLLTRLGLDILGEQEDITFQDLSFKVHLPTEKMGSFSIWGLGGKNSYDYTPNLRFVEDDYSLDTEGQKTGVFGITNIFYVSDDSFFETILSTSSATLTNQYDSVSRSVTDPDKFDVTLLDIGKSEETQVRFSTFYNHKFSARHTIRVGTILSRLGFNLNNQFFNQSENRYITELDENDHTYFVQGFGNWQYRSSKNLTWNIGLHASHFELSGDTYLEPRAGFKLNTSVGIFSGGAGLHSRMETVALYKAREEQEDGSYIQNNKDLGFTQAAHVALGFEKMLSKELRFKSEVYYQHLYNVPIWPNDTTSSDFLRTFSALNSLDGYTNAELANEGTGRNYGLELTLEKFLTRGFYLLTTASLYKSLYKGADEIERSTQFDGGYIFNILAGKEIKVGKQGNNILGFNGKLIFAGGKRQAPVDIVASRNQGGTVFDFDQNFETKLDGFFRMDIGITYRKNRKKMSSVLALNIQNVSQRENEVVRFYGRNSDSIVSGYQLNFFPNLSYRIEF